MGLMTSHDESSMPPPHCRLSPHRAHEGRVESLSRRPPQDGLQCALAAHGPALCVLHLDHAKLSAGDAAACFVALPCLRALKLSGLALDDSDLGAVAALPSLARLAIAGCSVHGCPCMTQRFLARARRLQTLTATELSFSPQHRRPCCQSVDTAVGWAIEEMPPEEAAGEEAGEVVGAAEAGGAESGGAEWGEAAENDVGGPSEDDALGGVLKRQQQLRIFEGGGERA
jgi:hypothetical protein